MSDLIDRQKAIDALRNLSFEHVFQCGEYYGEDERQLTIINARKAIDVIEAMPSAEPERKWIPFDVALPNDRQKVLCINKHDEMMVGGYLTDYGMTFPCYYEKPVAWMPLPEPYRGEK